MTGALSDAAERQRIERTGLSETLFVEAGAGTGKTHELVERIANLVVAAGVRLRDVAAITFTEAAAAELRDRIREAFEVRADEAGDADERATCRQAVADVDQAAIGTLHAFCLRILSEHPLEAGLPPRVDILDEVSSQLAFERRWGRFVDELFADAGAEELVVRAWLLDVVIEPRTAGSASLKDVARVFNDNWDRIGAAAAEVPATLGEPDWSAFEAAAAALSVLPGRCTGVDDKLLERMTEVLAGAGAVLGEKDPSRRLTLVRQRVGKWKSSNLGQQRNWPDKLEAQRAVDAVGEAAGAVVAGACNTVMRALSAHLARFTRDAAESRRAEGRLEFHDLLVLARRLLRTSGEARAALRRRYTRLLLDEFQDTDPIQIEVAVLIASAAGAEAPGAGDEAGARAWDEVATEAGRLFFVGDPKQSIYRFRRADIELFLAARDRFAGPTPVRLRQNFRTVEPVLAWVNHAFGKLMADEVPGAQPGYEAVVAHRADAPADHRVVVLGGARDLKAGPLRQLEATDVAAAINGIREDPGPWPVYDRGTKQWRPPRMADVTILLPTRTSLRQLEDALDAAGVPYRVDTGTLVYDTQEVREVLDALRAVDDPADAIALVSALRSPLYACSDVDLFTYHQAGGRWDVRRNPPAGVDAGHPVVRAMAHLRSLHEQRWWLEPSAMALRLVEERQAFALAFAHRRPREVWRRLRFLVDQARAFSEAVGGDLRAFLDWAELQRHEGSRVHEPLLPETDDDAVSILTIHGAKGLEFPITVVSGVTTAPRRRNSGVQVIWNGDQPEVKLTKGTRTDNFDRLADIEAEMDVYERRRLLYVACTRARDHLVVCTHNKPGSESYGSWLTEVTADVEGTLCRRLAEATAAPAPAPRVEPAIPVPAPPPDDDGRAGWLAAREALLERERRPRFLSATALAQLVEHPDAPDEADPEPAEDAGSPPARPWRRGRAGTAIGRAVHATLQLVDLATGDGLEDLAAQHAHIEAVPEMAGTVVALARSALAAPSVKAAVASGRYWRELYVAAPAGDVTIEGYVDLLYETGDGLVILDYKTDTVSTEVAMAEKLDRYAIQLGGYATALETATGLAVAGAFLVFCTANGPVEKAVELALVGATMEGRPEVEVRLLVADGSLTESTWRSGRGDGFPRSCTRMVTWRRSA
ncbi:MAG: UvrD-helicase domain-containing protein [Actinomycetota bacterium]|nr:UvrD-helicase domain-containing protein [Actinomycetota bacterium]